MDGMSASAKHVLRMLLLVAVICGLTCLLLFALRGTFEDNELQDGTYPLLNTNVRPLPSVVYDPGAQVWWFDVDDAGQSDSVEYDADQVRVAITNGPREVVVTNRGNNVVVVYLHKGDEITLSHGGVASAVVGTAASQ